MGLRAVKIDTLELAKELENAGVPRPLAEAHVHTTMKVVDMTIEQDLVTKHDLRHVVKHSEEILITKISDTNQELRKTEDKLLTAISQTNTELRKTEETLSFRIDKLDEKIDKLDEKVNKIEGKLSSRMDALDEKIDKVEEKLLTKMDKMDEKFSTEFAHANKETQDLKERVTKIETKIDKVFSDVVFRLGALGVLCTSTIIGVLLKLH